MKYLGEFIKAIIAGIMISIGGTVFLMCESKIIGSFLFAVGLFSICTMKYNLFTGKVCYLWENNLSYILDLVIILIGNLCGTLFTAFIESFTRSYPTLNEKALALCQSKLADSPLSLLILGFLCNILIYIAVDGYKNNEHEIGKYLAIVFGVMVFIVAGFEHCIADMYYFSIANCWTYDHAISAIIFVITGNCLGGLLLPGIKKIFG